MSVRRKTSHPEYRVEQIIAHEREADRLQADADSHRYEAARLIAEELATGVSQQVLADKIGKSQKHVSLMKAVHDQYQGSDLADRPGFNEAYQTSKTPPPPRKCPESGTALVDDECEWCRPVPDEDLFPDLFEGGIVPSEEELSRRRRELDDEAAMTFTVPGLTDLVTDDDDGDLVSVLHNQIANAFQTNVDVAVDGDEVTVATELPAELPVGKVRGMVEDTVGMMRRHAAVEGRPPEESVRPTLDDHPARKYLKAIDDAVWRLSVSLAEHGVEGIIEDLAATADGLADYAEMIRKNLDRAARPPVDADAPATEMVPDADDPRVRPSVLRALDGLRGDKRQEVWSRATELRDGKTPSPDSIKTARRRLGVPSGGGRWGR